MRPLTIIDNIIICILTALAVVGLFAIALEDVEPMPVPIPKEIPAASATTTTTMTTIYITTTTTDKTTKKTTTTRTTQLSNNSNKPWYYST